MSTHALGIMVSASALHAVLVERTEEETAVQFRQSVSKGGETDVPYGGAEDEVPGLEDEADDVTIQFGEDGGGDDLFLGSEFDEFDDEDEFSSASSAPTWNFQAALDDILDACAERGYEDPEIAFCTSTSNVDEVELRLPEDEGREASEDGPTGQPLPAARARLLEMLEAQYQGGVEDERVGFVPMHQTGDGRQRVLALIARPGGAVISTLSGMQEQTLARSPRAQLLDTEVSLYLGLARSALQLPPDTAEKTILVRTGAEDTLVLFMEGNTLRQAEHLPELTAEDPAETICSRVLLLQDEYGMGDVQHLLLAAETEEELLADAFKSYFARSKLRLLRAHLPDDALESSLYVAATGAALRLLDDSAFGPFFQDLNLLPKKCKASVFRLPVGWSVPVLLVLLGVTTLGFVWYYLTNASAIDAREAQLQSLEQEVAQVDQDALERRIDSLESASAQYAQGLDVLDQLHRGSNKWSRGLATVTERMNDIEGLSISEWTPEGETQVTVTGRASSRPRVVRLAQELDADVNSLTFTEVRDASVFDFQVTVPLDTTKPDAIQYWRDEQSAQAEAGERSDRPDTTTRASRADTAADQAGLGAEGTGPAAAPTGEAVSGSREDDGGSAPADTQETDAQWMIIVGSLAERDAAATAQRRVREKLEGRSYEVTVRHHPDRGRYRVGIGSFATLDDAQAGAEDLDDLLPAEAWIHRCTAPEMSLATTRPATLLASG
ncbi:MAG: SPOR domain-containing protein [Salinibacter sp.]